MLEMGVVVIFFMVVALVMQERLSIPLPVSLMGIPLILVALGLDEFHIQGKVFDEVILLLLPLLIAADVLNLKIKDLKQYWISVVLTAGVAVSLSIVAGVALHHLILPGYEIPIAAMVALMAMISATDPVSVTSIFANYKVPHKLKFIAESESLFNDATAFVIFSLALLSLSQEMTVFELAGISLFTVVSSILTGVLIGLIGVLLLRFVSDALAETAIVLFTAYLAFFIADEFGESAIFALVTSIVTVSAVVSHAASKSLEISDYTAPKRVAWLYEHLENTYQNRTQIVQFLTFTALIANVILFMSMAHFILLVSLFDYWQEILSVFIASTLIRALMMWFFMKTSNRFKSIQNVSVGWWGVLVFAGVKGGLSILMVHMLPADFEHKELFTAIIIGNILLTTFVYSVILMVFIKWREKQIMAYD